MTLSVSTRRRETLESPAAGASLAMTGLATATVGATAAVAAIELMRNRRLFIGDFHYGNIPCDPICNLAASRLTSRRRRYAHAREVRPKSDKARWNFKKPYS